MQSWFLNRGYPSWLIKKQMEKVKHSHLNDRKKAQKSQGLPLVITYHPLFKTFGNTIRKHLNLLYMNEKFKRVFTLCSMVSFPGARKLSSYLVRAKLYSLERSVVNVVKDTAKYAKMFVKQTPLKDRSPTKNTK